MKKENIFLVDIYQIKGAQKQVYFNDFGCEAGALQTQQILLERSVPAVKMHNLYVPLKHIRNLRDYLELLLNANDTISYHDSRYLDQWVHIFAAYNQKIVKNIQPAFKDKGNIKLSTLLKMYNNHQEEQSMEM